MPVQRARVTSMSCREDGTNFNKSSTRRFRNALEITKRAVEDWATQCRTGGVPGWGDQIDISFVAQMGDVIDGSNRAAGVSDCALRTVLDELAKSPSNRFVHLIGNHELYNFSRADLARKLPSNPPGMEDTPSRPRLSAYFSFLPHPKWRVVVLDPYDVSTIGPGSGDAEDAFKLLEQNNPNNVRGPSDWLEGLTGVSRRWVPYNGGVGEEQLAWLEATLRASEEAGVRVIVLSHVPVCPGSSADSTLVWNYERILAMFEAYACVAAFLCGHDHKGGYKLEKGVHHVTVESPLECELGETAYGLMVVTEDHLVLYGSVFAASFSVMHRTASARSMLHAARPPEREKKSERASEGESPSPAPQLRTRARTR